MVLNNHTLLQQKALVISPECVSADCQSSYCQEPVTVWRIISGQELDWVAEKTFQRVRQRVPQRPGHKPQFLGVVCSGPSNLASQSHHRGACGRKLTDLSGTARKWPPKARATSTFTAAPTHSCPMCGRVLRARIGLTSIFGLIVPSPQSEVMVIFDFFSKDEQQEQQRLE